MQKENANIRDSDDRSSGCGILGKKKRVQDPALQTLSAQEITKYVMQPVFFLDVTELLSISNSDVYFE